MYNVVFFFHILGVLAFVSGFVLAGVAFESARRVQRPAEVATLLGLSRVGAALLGPGALVAGACGLWLVHLGKWHYSSFWVSCSIVLFVAAMALGGSGGSASQAGAPARDATGSRARDDLRGAQCAAQ